MAMKRERCRSKTEAGCKNRVGVVLQNIQTMTNLNVVADVLGIERRRVEAAFQMLPLRDQLA